jgi:hypothetical protein
MGRPRKRFARRERNKTEPDRGVPPVRSLIRTEPVRYRPIQIQWCWCIVFVGAGGAHLRAVKKTTATAACVEEAELDGDGRNRLRRGSSTNSQRRLGPGRSNAAALSASSASPAGLATSRWVCLGGSWDRGESSRLIDGGFYRPGRRGRGRPVARRCGGPGRVRRATLGTAVLLACWRGSVSATGCCGSALAQSRWSATCSELGKKRGGVLGAVSSSPPFLMARVGAEGARLDRGIVQEHGYRHETNGDSGLHSELDFSRFLSARCSTKCPQEIQIWNFENFHFGWSTY